MFIINLKIFLLIHWKNKQKTSLVAWRTCHFDHKQPWINPNTPIDCLQLQVHNLFLLFIILIISSIICKKNSKTYIAQPQKFCCWNIVKLKSKIEIEKTVGPERKGPYVTFCQIEKIGFKVQNSRKNNFSYKKNYFYAYLWSYYQLKQISLGLSYVL